MSAFLDELKRRGVMRAAAVYAVVAWAIIESTATIFPALGIPEWTVTAVIITALIGFPIALVVAWVFDLTRGGIVRTPNRAQLDPAQLQGLSRGRAIEFVIIAVLGVAVLWLGWDRLNRPESEGLADADRLDSIAVLPFANLSDDPANEYFGDGLAEELLNVLVKIEGLRVTARTSSFEYRGQNLDIRQIGQALGVSTILEGSVRKFGERVRVTAQLIRAEDGFHLWSETFDRDLADIFAVQDEISAAIAEALRGTFAGANDADTTLEQRHQTSSVAAFEAYLRGRYAMNQRTRESLAQAVTDFRLAISIDPEYAAAFSGLADSYLLQSTYADRDHTEGLRLAEPMMQRAIDLDPNLAEAQASRGFVLGEKGQNQQAIAAFKQAIELNPSYSPAHHWLALRYEMTGRFVEAKQVLETGLKIDPNYVTGKRVLLGLLRALGDHARADALAKRMIEDHPSDSLVLYSVGEDAVGRNQLVKAVRILSRAVQLQPDSVLFRISLVKALASAGDLERAESQVAVARQLAPDNPMLALWPLQRALISGNFDNGEQLVESLTTQAAQNHGLEREVCDFAVASGDAQLTIETCGAMWERAQWKSGDPLPPEITNSVAGLFTAYDIAGREESAASLTLASEEALDALDANGMSKQMVGFFRAQVAMHEGDIEPLIARLPEWLDTHPITATNLQHDLTWAPLRDDPRFQALVAQTAERQARVLDQVRGLPLPE